MNENSDLAFRDVKIDPRKRRLVIDGQEARIGSRAFDVLVTLAERQGAIVSSKDLLEAVWPRITVQETNLRVQIAALRDLLGAGAIENIPGRGYRLSLERAVGENASSQTEPATGGAAARDETHGLFGRETDLDAVKALISDHRLVSIVGPGGIGKTRLARAVASTPSGANARVAVVDLAAVGDPASITSATARALGLQGTPQGAPAEALSARLGEESILIVLDNCEHLLDPISELARVLIAATRSVRLLVTSQAPLRLPEEAIYRLGPLGWPAKSEVVRALDYGAVALFAARARQVNFRFAVGKDNVEDVVDICAQLDGVPLAIELAAARVEILGLHGVRRRLDDRLRLLAAATRGALPRHRALEAALEWSYRLLTEDERRALDFLGVFVGGFTLEAVCAVIGEDGVSEWEATDRLAQLVEKSLVMVEPGETPRYRLLESTRAFALQRLESRGLLREARRRHARALIASWRSHASGASPAVRSRRMLLDLENLRAAMRWTVGEDGERLAAIDIATEFNWLWFVLGMVEEGARFLETVRPWVNDDTPEPVAARFYLSQAKNTSASAKFSGGYALRAADMFRRLNDRPQLFDALYAVAIQYAYIGRSDIVDQATAEMEAILDPAWPVEARVLIGFARAHRDCWVGAPAAAKAYLEGMLAAMERDPKLDLPIADTMRVMLVGCYYALGESKAALDAAEAFLRLEAIPSRGLARTIMASFRVGAHIQLGLLDTAETDLRGLLPQLQLALGSPHGALCPIAFLCARRGKFSISARLLGAVEALHPVDAMGLSPSYRVSRDAAAELALVALGREEFEREKTAGRALTLDQALALGLPGGGLATREK